MQGVFEKLAYTYNVKGMADSFVEEEQFLCNLFREKHVKTVLDCACGIGMHLCKLFKHGFEVYGSDISDSMLAIAKKNLCERNFNVPLKKCDFRYIEQKFECCFDAIICLTTSLPQLHTEADLLCALSSMRKRLNKNGVLVLTQGITDFNLTLPMVDIICNERDFSRVFIKELNEDFLKVNILDMFHDGNSTKTNQYQIIYKILLADDYRRLLKMVGFSKISLYGNYELEEYHDKSNRLIVVAEVD